MSMIEKILERLEKESDFFGGEPMGTLQKHFYCEGVKKAIEIVQEVAKEYGKDTNVRSNEWIPTAEMLFPRYGQKVLASVKCLPPDLPLCAVPRLCDPQLLPAEPDRKSVV